MTKDVLTFNQGTEVNKMLDSIKALGLIATSSILGDGAAAMQAFARRPVL